MMRVVSASVLAAVLAVLVPGVALAQMGQPAATNNPFSASLKTMYDGVSRNFVEAAEKFPEADYAFKPTPQVRSFGEIVGHLADANYASCARAKGEKNPNDGNSFEKETTKAGLVKAVKDAVAYCGTVYGIASDAMLLQMIKVGEREMLRSTSLVGNISHSNEHYGNIVTYMRLKGLVPPSTERSQQPMPRPSSH
jgi:uncharacterized damage-inducible protein DinB